jgi:hypothetical protein
MSTIVTLDESSHTYSDNHGNSYQSVSAFLGLFSKKFDRLGISKMSAAKAGVSQEEILAQWDKKRDDSIDHGNRIHNNLEAYMKTTQVLGGNEDLLPLCKSISAEYSKYYRTYQEEILFSEEHLLAGKTDNRFQHTSSKNSMVSFGDFKTNLSNGIQMENKYGQYMTGPLSHLQDCNFNKYALQLSTYAYLYQLATGAKICNLHILFIPPENFLSWRKIYVPYMKLEVEAMLEYKKNNAIVIETPAPAKSVINNLGNSEWNM